MNRKIYRARCPDCGWERKAPEGEKVYCKGCLSLMVKMPLDAGTSKRQREITQPHLTQPDRKSQGGAV